MGDTASAVAWTAAICSGLGALVGGVTTGLATAWVMIRNANAAINMGEKKEDHSVAAAAYALFKDSMNQRVAALEQALSQVTEKLEHSREAHAKCEVVTADLRGDIRVMQKEIEALKRHENANKQQIELNTKKADEIEAKLPKP